MDEQPERFPIQAEDDDVDIPDESMQVQGAKIPKGRVAIHFFVVGARCLLAGRT